MWEGLLAQMERLQANSGATHAMVVVDYLQVFPLPPDLAEPPEGADHWWVGAMKLLRDRSSAAVLVISEVDKPSPSQPWASTLSEVAGSAV